MYHGGVDDAVFNDDVKWSQVTQAVQSYKVLVDGASPATKLPPFGTVTKGASPPPPPLQFVTVNGTAYGVGVYNNQPVTIKTLGSSGKMLFLGFHEANFDKDADIRYHGTRADETVA